MLIRICGGVIAGCLAVYVGFAGIYSAAAKGIVLWPEPWSWIIAAVALAAVIVGVVAAVTASSRKPPPPAPQRVTRTFGGNVTGGSVDRVRSTADEVFSGDVNGTEVGEIRHEPKG